MDPGAYITGFYALFRRHLVTQVPTEITCFTHRRHKRRTDRVTPAGRLRFICVPPDIYDRPESEVIMPAEPALCDFVWLSLRKGIDPQSLVTFRNLDALGRRRLGKALRGYPRKVRSTIRRIAGPAPDPDSQSLLCRV